MPAIERLLFFGTPDFAVSTLAALVGAGHSPVLVVARPARPVGRGREVAEPPVARWARERGLEVGQPERVRDPLFLARVAALAPDVLVVVAYGQIFPPELLRLPRLGCVNLHASLLPRHRGAAPVQAALAAGDRTTGVTTMLMTEGLDEGPILLQEETAIRPGESAGELGARLAELGAGLVVRTLDGLASGALAPRAQAAAAATYAPRLAKQAARVDWTLPAARLGDLLRAYTPWPGLEARLRERPVKILRAAADGDGAPGPEAPGSVLGLRDGRLLVRCGGASVLAIEELQRPGRRPVRAADFVNGERLRPGERFA